MQVTVIFNFPDITDPDSPEADEVVEMLTEATTEWAADFKAAYTYVDDVTEADVGRLPYGLN